MRRQLLTGLLMTVVLTVLLGVVYPLAVTGVSQLAFAHKANGSFVKDKAGKVVGSSSLGQQFVDADGNPVAKYFQPRPSAYHYDAMSSGGSNYGPSNPRLIATCLKITDNKGVSCDPNTIPQRAKAYRTLNGLATDATVPVDAVTASASGLDPDISPANARLQAARVAKARGLSLTEVLALVHSNTADRNLGFIGEPIVHVLALNLALDKLA